MQLLPLHLCHYVDLLKDKYALLLLSTILSIGRSLLIIPMAWLIRNIFDHIIPSGNVVHLVQAGLLLVFLQLAHSAIGLWIKYQCAHVSRFVTKKIIKDLLDTLYTLSRHYYSKTDWGQLHARLIHNIEHTEKFTETLLVQIIPASILFIILIGFLWTLNAYLFFILAAMIPMFWLTYDKTKKYHIVQSRFYWQAKRMVNRNLLALIQMMDLVHIQTAQIQESIRQEKAVDELCHQSERFVWGRALHAGIQESLLIIAGVAILVAGGSAVAYHQMTVGELMAFYAGVILLKPNMQVLISSVPTLFDGNEALKSLSDLQKQAEYHPYSGQESIDFKGSIEVSKVCFQYENKLLLDEINLSLPRGSTTIIAGENGSGKSTLIYLLLGFYRPTTGRILADTCRYDELDMDMLRQKIGVVMQEPLLFSDTIYENIAYGCPDVSIAEVIQAATAGMAHDFITELPLGYETVIGERGMRLSGGQRQRIALARALLREPKLLILDEPTNHLDEASICQLLQFLKKNKKTLTILIITHDLRFSQQADQTFYLYNRQLHQSRPLNTTHAFKENAHEN